MYIRRQTFNGIGNESTFLWGARQTGKSTLLKYLFPNSVYFDLLLTNEYEKLLRNPSILRERVELSDPRQPIIIDEIQRIPELLNEVQWLIVNKNFRFILSGSSPRKILRTGANLLGGRAYRYELYPLIYLEIPDFKLDKALNSGLLPRHYISSGPQKMLSAYIGSYLQDEIVAEAKIRNITSFASFLEKAAFSNGEIVNYSNIAAECGVSSPTIKEYFQILEDTLIGNFVPSFQKRPKRRVLHAPKFYLFDVGIANYLLKRGEIKIGSEAFGSAFEHFMYHEINAHSHYSDIRYQISYWRTTSQFEVDFILGDHEVAIEIKATDNVLPKHLKGLIAFSQEYKVKKLIVVSNDAFPRQLNNITILPWRTFIQQLWAGEIIR
jgi:predicted AAA+ superfamily ATPase